MDEKDMRNNAWRRLKVLGALIVVAFAVTLAVMVGNRLSNESLAVLAGAVCGVGAAIPTSLLIVAIARRRDEPRNVQPAMPQGAYPPVIVVTPPGVPQQAGDWNTLPPSLRAPVQRQFTIVGGASGDADTTPY